MKLIDVLRAVRNIEGKVNWTPLICSTTLSERANCDVYLKLENLQVTGSFKFRSALKLVC